MWPQLRIPSQIFKYFIISIVMHLVLGVFVWIGFGIPKDRGVNGFVFIPLADVGEYSGANDHAMKASPMINESFIEKKMMNLGVDILKPKSVVP